MSVEEARNADTVVYKRGEDYWINACLHVVFCVKGVDACPICQKIALQARREAGRAQANGGATDG